LRKLSSGVGGDGKTFGIFPPGSSLSSHLLAAIMSATVPLSSSIMNSSRIRALSRLRLISSHLSTSGTSSSSTSLPRSPLAARQFSIGPSRRQSTSQFSFTTACSFRGKPGSPVYNPLNNNNDSDEEESRNRGRGRGGREGRLKQGLDASHPLSKWRDSQLEKSPNGAGHDWFFVEGIPSSPNEAKQVESTTTSTPATTEQGGNEIEKVRIGGIKGVVLGVAGAQSLRLELYEKTYILISKKLLCRWSRRLGRIRSRSFTFRSSFNVVRERTSQEWRS